MLFRSALNLNDSAWILRFPWKLLTPGPKRALWLALHIAAHTDVSGHCGFKLGSIASMSIALRKKKHNLHFMVSSKQYFQIFFSLATGGQRAEQLCSELGNYSSYSTCCCPVFRQSNPLIQALLCVVCMSLRGLENVKS